MVVHIMVMWEIKKKKSHIGHLYANTSENILIT